MGNISEARPLNEKKRIEIRREIERNLGNRMVLDRIRQGEYKLKTGEADPERTRTELYPEVQDVEGELEKVVREIDREEGLDLEDHDVSMHTKDLQRQMKSGRRRMQILVRQKQENKEEGKKKGWFF